MERIKNNSKTGSDSNIPTNFSVKTPRSTEDEDLRYRAVITEALETKDPIAAGEVFLRAANYAKEYLSEKAEAFAIVSKLERDFSVVEKNRWGTRKGNYEMMAHNYHEVMDGRLPANKYNNLYLRMYNFLSLVSKHLDRESKISALTLAQEINDKHLESKQKSAITELTSLQMAEHLSSLEHRSENGSLAGVAERIEQLFELVEHSNMNKDELVKKIIKPYKKSISKTQKVIEKSTPESFQYYIDPAIVIQKVFIQNFRNTQELLKINQAFLNNAKIIYEKRKAAGEQTWEQWKNEMLNREKRKDTPTVPRGSGSDVDMG